MSKLKSDNDLSGTVTGAFVLIGLGTMILLINSGILPRWNDAWPAILIVIGVAMLVGAMFKKKKSDDGGQS